MTLTRCCLLALLVGATALPARAGDFPPHAPLRVLVVSDEVNPHGLSAAELTQPGDLSAALLGPGTGLTIDAVLEVPTDDIDLATAALAIPAGDPSAYDVLVYFAHRIPADDSPAQNQADQDAFVAALDAFLVAGGGVVAFHHGLYTASGKAGVLDLLGATASSVSWQPVAGQDVIAVDPNHFVTTQGVEYTGTRSYADAAFGVPPGDYPVFANAPDERYPALQVNAGAGTIEPLFASDYVQGGATHILGYTHRRAGWDGVVVAWQPGEYQPSALDDVDGNPFQILGNALLYAANACAEPGSHELYGSALAGADTEPVLDVVGAEPSLGATVTVQAQSSSASTTLTGLLFIGFGRASFPTKGGALVVAPPWIQLALPVPPTGLPLPLALPFDPILCGAEIDLQLIMLDPGAIFGAAFSQGLALFPGS